MSFADLLDRLTSAAAASDVAGVAACFAEDAVYESVFYGVVQGRDEIAEIVGARIHQHGEGYRWDMFDAVEDGRTGYARYVVSYRPRRADGADRRAVSEGVIVAKLRDGSFSDYREIGDPAPALLTIGFSEAQIARYAAKRAEALRARPEVARHLE